MRALDGLLKLLMYVLSIGPQVRKLEPNLRAFLPHPSGLLFLLLVDAIAVRLQGLLYLTPLSHRSAKHRGYYLLRAIFAFLLTLSGPRLCLGK